MRGEANQICSKKMTFQESWSRKLLKDLETDPKCTNYRARIRDGSSSTEYSSEVHFWNSPPSAHCGKVAMRELDSATSAATDGCIQSDAWERHIHRYNSDAGCCRSCFHSVALRSRVGEDFVCRGTQVHLVVRTAFYCYALHCTIHA